MLALSASPALGEIPEGEVFSRPSVREISQTSAVLMGESRGLTRRWFVTYRNGEAKRSEDIPGDGLAEVRYMALRCGTDYSFYLAGEVRARAVHGLQRSFRTTSCGGTPNELNVPRSDAELAATKANGADEPSVTIINPNPQEPDPTYLTSSEIIALATPTPRLSIPPSPSAHALAHGITNSSAIVEGQVPDAAVEKFIEINVGNDLERFAERGGGKIQHQFNWLMCNTIYSFAVVYSLGNQNLEADHGNFSTDGCLPQETKAFPTDRMFRVETQLPEVSGNRAILHGTLYGRAARVFFKFDRGFGAEEIGSQDVKRGKFSFFVDGLQLNGGYCVRAFAENETGDRTWGLQLPVNLGLYRNCNNDANTNATPAVEPSNDAGTMSSEGQPDVIPEGNPINFPGMPDETRQSLWNQVEPWLSAIVALIIGWVVWRLKMLRTSPLRFIPVKDHEIIPGPLPLSRQKKDYPVAASGVHQLETATVIHEKSALYQGKKAKYRIIETIDSGGFGTAFIAIDTRDQKCVCIKQPHATPKIVTKFQSEIANLVSLKRLRGVPEFLDHGTSPLVNGVPASGLPFVVMELISGKTLRVVLLERKLSDDECCLIVRSIADTLRYVHPGLIHRDLKPENIMFRDCDLDDVVVIDWGLGVLPEASLTGSGSPGYQCPEFFQEQTPAGDIYSLGVILLEMLIGRNPFEQGQTMYWQQFQERRAEHLIQLGIESNWHALLSRMLDGAPRNRPDARAIEAWWRS